jgi:hypothetical protein
MVKEFFVEQTRYLLARAPNKTSVETEASLQKEAAIGRRCAGSERTKKDSLGSAPKARRYPAELSAETRELYRRIEAFKALSEPPDEAECQDDASFLITLEDSSTLRWTQRLNGTWRNLEHKKAGWVGTLDQKKYVIPQRRAELVKKGWQ